MNMQYWQRLGHVFCANRENENIFSHATYPTPLVLDEKRVRIFFSPRDALNRSCITYLDLGIDNEKFEVLYLSQEPVLFPGVRGAFDDSGVTVSSIVRDENGHLLLYYLGWHLSVTVPFQNSIGLAKGKADGASFTKISQAPIIGRSDIDPFTLGYPWVLQGNSHWRMWYGSHLSWGKERMDMLHVIKDAESADAIHWQCGGHVSIPLASDKEFAVSRPCVIFNGKKYQMWYSRRNPGYCMGYAESDDGVNWNRQDSILSFQGAIQPWEHECVEYAAVFDLAGHRYMLYNGNGYGRTGFGLAMLAC